MKSRPSTTKSSDRPSFMSDLVAQQDVIKVHSRLKRWYYTSFKGYRVARESALPTSSLFGGISYKHTWVLKKASG